MAKRNFSSRDQIISIAANGTADFVGGDGSGTPKNDPNADSFRGAGGANGDFNGSNLSFADVVGAGPSQDGKSVSDQTEPPQQIPPTSDAVARNVLAQTTVGNAFPRADDTVQNGAGFAVTPVGQTVAQAILGAPAEQAPIGGFPAPVAQNPDPSAIAGFASAGDIGGWSSPVAAAGPNSQMTSQDTLAGGSSMGSSSLPGSLQQWLLEVGGSAAPNLANDGAGGIAFAPGLFNAIAAIPAAAPLPTQASPAGFAPDIGLAPAIGGLK